MRMRMVFVYCLFSLLSFISACTTSGADSTEGISDADLYTQDTVAEHDEYPAVDDDITQVDGDFLFDGNDAMPKNDADATVLVDEEENPDSDSVSDDWVDMENDMEADVDEQVEDVSFDTDESVDLDSAPDEDPFVSVQDNDDGSTTVTVRLHEPSDVVTSYLMDAATHSWNYFYGESVPLGFRLYDAAADSYVAYHTAFRFTDIPVPVGAKVVETWLYLLPTNEVDSSKKVYLTVAFEKNGSSAPFDTTNYTTDRPDQRTMTDTRIEEYLLKCIELSDCYDPDSDYCKERALDCWDRDTPYRIRKNLADAAQEVFDMPEWRPGNAITVLVAGTYPHEMPASEYPAYSNSRQVTGVDADRGLDYYPKLVVTYR